MIGTRTQVDVGDVVTQVDPPEDGIVTVKTKEGEVGALPEDCLGKPFRQIFLYKL